MAKETTNKPKSIHDRRAAKPKVFPAILPVPVGRPPKYKTASQLIPLISDYFIFCGKKKRAPTKSGLALHLCLLPDTVTELARKPEFAGPIRFAYTIIDDWWNQLLTVPNATGAIFYHKAALGYRDQPELDETNRSELDQLRLAVQYLLATHGEVKKSNPKRPARDMPAIARAIPD